MLSRCEDSLEQDALDYRFQAADQSEVKKNQTIIKINQVKNVYESTVSNHNM